MSTSNGSIPEIDPGIRDFLSLKIISLSFFQFLVKEWAFDTGKLPPGGLPSNSVVKLLTFLA